MLKAQLLEKMDSLLDPVLPELATALDADSMLVSFGAQMLVLGLVWGWRVAKCAIEKVYYHPHRRCGILYHLGFRDEANNEVDEWIYGEMLPSGDDQKRFKKLAATSAPHQSPCACLQEVPAVSLWQDFHMILRVFPNDAELQSLPRVIDPAYMKNVLEAHLPELGLPADAGWRCESARFDHVKLLPGKRCVLRHQATLVGPDETERTLRLFSKTYVDNRTRLSFDLLQTAYNHLAVGAERINIPKPLFYLSDSDTYWQEEWPGEALSDVALEYDWNELFPRIAQNLSIMHRKTIVGLDAAPTIAEIYREVARDATKLVQAVPQVQGLADTILHKLQLHHERLAAQSLPAATLHGACRLEQFLIRGAELALIDFDALAQGDPLADVAEFMASLQYLALSRSFPPERIAAGVARLAESYAAQTPWPYERQRVAWYVLAFLITKMYSATKNLDTEALHNLKHLGETMCQAWLEQL